MTIRTLFSRAFFGAFAAAIALGCGSASASLTTVGNTAPGNRIISIEIDGQLVAENLGYLQFKQVDLAPGPRQARLLDAFTGQLLASENLLVTAFDSNWLSLGGDGSSARPFTSIRSGFISGLNASGGRLGVVNAAADRIGYTHRCAAPDGFRAGQGSGNPPYRDVGYATTPDLFCRFDSARYIGSTVEALPAYELNFQAGELRFLVFVGNGTATAPYQWVQVREGLVSAPTLAPEQDLLRVVKSIYYWYDSGRFSQGVTLFEVSRTLAVHGMWNTYTAGGRPQWLYLDGGVVDPSGRREVLVSDYVIDAAGKRQGTTIGRGTLTYIDCNEAELQVLFADGSSRAARFRRSVSVETCAAVP